MNVEQQTLVRTIKDLAGLLSASGKREVLAHLTAILAANLETVSPEARAAVKNALPPVPSVATSLESSRREYADSRQEHAPHQAIDFKLTISGEITAEDFLIGLLGNEDYKVLVQYYEGDRNKLTANAPSESKMALFLESNNKYRDTQGEDFKSAGLVFADNLHAMLICSVVVKKARDAGLNLAKDADSWRVEQGAAIAKLSEAEIDLLTKLTTGVVRTRSSNFRVNVNGRLCAPGFYDGSSSLSWAAGGVASAAA